MFQNVIMPGVPADQMHGILALLALIGNPQAQAAADFLAKLSAEKDAAVELAKQAATDRVEAERLHGETKERHDGIVGRLAKAEADLRARIEGHATTAAKLQEREDDLRVKQTLHASAVAAHQTEAEAVKASHEVREAALTEREKTVADAHLDIERRKEEFQKHMAPVLAAAALAGGM